jgi:peroxiredoxin Q/BCP
MTTAGKEVSLEDYANKALILFFYPKDDTPGCTKEACAFRDSYEALVARGVALLGVSKDSIASHQKFIEKYHLPFPLLSDPEGELLEAFGVWREKNMYGKKVMGVERSTFLIDGEGVVRKVWRRVKVDGHVEAVARALDALTGQA